MTRVTIQDVRAARYCLAGVRPWFVRHGLNWQAFLDAGVEAEQLRATGDALVDPVINAAIAREASGQASTHSNAQDSSHGRV